MSDYIFLFDLDSTVTSEEILPTISKKINRQAEMREITEKTMKGELPFKLSFLQRVDILKDIPISEVQDIVNNINMNKQILNFIQENRERCYIVTGNLDVWISPLMEKIGMKDHYFSSKALAKGDKLEKIVSIIDKNTVVDQFISPLVAVGDGDNDASMINRAEIGIAYGGVRKVSSSVINCATHAFYEEGAICQFLKRLL